MNNTENVKIKLYYYKNLTSKINDLTDEIESVMKMILTYDGLKSMEYKLIESQKTNNKGKDISSMIVEIDNDLHTFIEYCKNQVNELINVKVEIDEGLNLLNINERKIIELRYFKNMKWEEINKELHFERRWTNEQHRKALTKICENVTF